MPASFTQLEAAFARSQSGDHAGFEDWVRAVEPLLRRTLKSFVRVVDVEAIVQEALLRMWVTAPGLRLEGPDASLRFVRRVARNLAINEARRRGASTLDREEWERHEPSVNPAPASDDELRRAIAECLGRLPRKPAQALWARLRSQGGRPDRELARRVGMRLNTFLQNIVRARRHLAECLRPRGVALEEFLP